MQLFVVWRRRNTTGRADLDGKPRRLYESHHALTLTNIIYCLFFTITLYSITMLEDTLSVESAHSGSIFSKFRPKATRMCNDNRQIVSFRDQSL